MKHSVKTFLQLLIVITLILYGCGDQNEIHPNGSEVGYLSLNLGLDVSGLSDGRVSAVSTDTWNVIVYDATDQEVYNYEDFSDVPSEIELDAGDYTVFVSSEDEGVAFDQPFYTGTSDVVTIVKGEVEPVTVNAALANVKVSIAYTAAVQADFTDWNTTVSSLSGSLTFLKDEIRSGYFIAGEDLLLTANMSYLKADMTTATRSLSGTISNTNPQDHYLVTIDYDLESGAISPLIIVVDETTNDIEIDITRPPVNGTFIDVFGGSGIDVGVCLIETADEGFIIGGQSNSSDGDITTNNGSNDWVIIKTDASGNIQWSNTYGSTFSEELNRVIPTQDGGYIASGTAGGGTGDVSTFYGGIDDFWVVKFDGAGNIEWEKTYGGSGRDSDLFILENSDGTYTIAGSTSSPDGDILGFPHPGPYYYVLWVAKLDTNGDILWQSMISDTYDLSIQDFQFNYAQNQYVLMADRSSSSSFGSLTTILVATIDLSGNIIWSDDFGGNGDDESGALLGTSDGGYICTGSTFSADGDVSSKYGANDVWVFKLNSSGTIEWEKTYGGSGLDYGHGIAINSDGNYIVTGSTKSSDFDVSSNYGGDDLWLFETDPNGNLIWENSIGGTLNDAGGKVIPTTDGGYAIVGSSTSSDGHILSNAGNRDLIYVKLNSQGNF
ncbi:MAG: DUF4493 domain-containing protein [Marinoscillum sp.]